MLPPMLHPPKHYGEHFTYRPSAFRSRALIDDTRPQFVQVIWYARDVVKTGMKNSVNFRARSSRWWWTNCPQFRQVAGLPGSARRTVLRPKIRSIRSAFRVLPEG